MRLLSLLGVKAFLGTLPNDPLTSKRGSDGVAISYEFWQHHYGGDPHVLGKGVFVDTASMHVAAVLEAGISTSLAPESPRFT